ncbi:internal scaffolding protein [Peromfec virus RodF7_10]|uniref:Internal scaffolding protein n=1 Tax=Peromfec virus RodF7_10 TaxID=2929346 RepID=A0A976R7T5_9VIRU|nr:internal scaffolding protein [Peromfec virus RodF7_10]
MKFKSFYVNRPDPVTVVPDTETKFVDQSEADRASLKFQLERYGMDSLLQQFEKTKSQFGYADTRLCKDFAELQQKAAEANSYFMQLPSRIRAKFHHSSTEFFTSLEQNPSKAYDEGYISKSLAAQLGVEKAIDKPIETIDPIVTPVTPVTPAEVVESVVTEPSA